MIFFSRSSSNPVAQGQFNDECWEHHTHNLILLCRRHSEGKWRKLAKTKKKLKQGKENGKTLICLHFSVFQALGCTVTIKYLPFIQHLQIKAIDRIIWLRRDSWRVFHYSQQLSTQVCLHHTRNGFLTQTKNNSSAMSLFGNVGKALKSLLKFLGQQARQAVWQHSPHEAEQQLCAVWAQGEPWLCSPCAAQAPHCRSLLSTAQHCWQQQLPNSHHFTDCCLLQHKDKIQ